MLKARLHHSGEGRNSFVEACGEDDTGNHRSFRLLIEFESDAPVLSGLNRRLHGL
jgi:hypothetical protein